MSRRRDVIARRSVVTRVLLLALLALSFSAFASHVVRADSSAITVLSTDATSSFPSGATFSISAESDAPIKTIELLYAESRLATYNLAVPSFTPATRVDAKVETDFQAAYVPAGIDLRYHWRITDQNGDSFETDEATLTWKDTRFDWTKVVSDQVEVYAYNGNEAFNKQILDSAQATVDRLEKAYDVPTSLPIRIWVYDARDDFAGSQATNSQEWIAGSAYPDLQVILAVLPEGNQREVGRVVPHEISHQVLHQAVLNPFNTVPTWFDEGLAVTSQENGAEDYRAVVQRASDEGRLMSIRSLNSEFPYDPALATLAYAESYSVVSFIKDHWGQQSITAMIEAYRTGVSHDDAAKQALGVDLDGLDRLWKENLGYAGDRPAGAASIHAGPSPWDGVMTQPLAVIVSAVVLGSGALTIRRWLLSDRGLTPDEIDEDLSSFEHPNPAMRSGPIL